MSLFGNSVSQEAVDTKFLQIGAPGEDLLDRAHRVFQECMLEYKIKPDQKRFADDDNDDLTPLFQYGPKEGPPIFRKECSRFLTEQYGDKVDPNNLLLTCGATHGLHLIASTLVQQGGVVFVEDPTYFLALDVLQADLGLRVQSFLAIDDQLMQNIAKAEKEQASKSNDASSSSERFWGMVYVIPNFQNPTGRCMSSEDCKNLIDLAKEFKLLIVCDDVYNLLWYQGESCPKRLLQWDKEGSNIISNGTFSKVLAPGVRVGWIEAAPSIISKLADTGVLNSGGSTNNVMSGLIARAMRRGLLRDHLQYLRDNYRNRMRLATDYLRENLPDQFRFETPEGGYFIWIQGPEDFDGTNFVREALANGVEVLPGQRASGNRLDPQKNLNAIRVSIAYYQSKSLLEGCRRLCHTLSKV